jgi:HSP20 family molecular chaperone IbpA
MMTPFGFSLLDEMRPSREELSIDEDDDRIQIKMGLAGIKPEDVKVRLGIIKLEDVKVRLASSRRMSR